MAMFSYVYYWTYISSTELGVGDVLDKALKLGDRQQLELFGKLGNLLVGESLLPGAWWLAPGPGGWGGRRTSHVASSRGCLASWATCWWGRACC